MIDESALIRGVLGSVLGGRRRRRRMFSSPTTLLTAAGLVWGVAETMRQSGGASSLPEAPGAPPPVPGAGGPAAGVSEGTMRVVRLAISAAGADGTVDDDERAAILEQASAAGVGELVGAELKRPRALAEIVRGVTDEAERRSLYVVAYGVVRGDEQPNGAERIYLARLADLLGLDPAGVQDLERRAVQGIAG